MKDFLIVTATADPKDGAAYTDGDVIGGLLTFTVTGTVSNGAILNSLYMVDDDSEGAALRLYLFDTEPSAIADDAAFAPSAADLKEMFGTIDIAAADYVTVNSLDYVYKDDINQVIQFDGKNQFYGYLVCNGSTPTYAADKTLYIRLTLMP